jgi:hypothetical protein
VPSADTSWGTRAVRAEGEWIRGTARVIDDVVIELLDDGRAEVYDWTIAPTLPYDLAAIRHPAEVGGFVRKWGLLHGDEDDPVEGLPSIDGFMREAFRMNWLLYRCALVRPGSDRRQLAEYWAGFYTGVLNAKWLQDPRRGRNLPPGFLDRVARKADYKEMAIDVREGLEEDIWEYVERASLSIRSLDFFETAIGEPKPPGDFILTARPPNLLVRAYVEVAFEMTGGVSVSVCPTDGRVFPIRDPRQIYCSSQCAGRARYRRFAERRRSQS